MKALRRGLGVGGRKREMVGITLKGKRVGSRGKKVKAKVKVKKERVDMGKSGREKTEGEEQ